MQPITSYGIEPHRVVVVRALPGLGDFLCAVPALRLLRKRLPDAHISLVGLDSTRHLVQRYNCYVDELIPFPGFPGIIERPPRVEALPDFLSAMHERAFDLALQMHGDGSFINIFTILLGAQCITAYFPPTQRPPHEFPGLFIPYPQQLHEIQRNLRLVYALGQGDGIRSPISDCEFPDSKLEIDFPLTDADYDEYGRLVRHSDLLSGQYVCIHAGASHPSRRWPLASFTAVGRMLRQQGLQLVLTGAAQDGPRNARLAQALSDTPGHQAPPVDLSGQTDLGPLALVLRHARLLICNDTGVSHLAVATRTPSVVICLASERHRWAPLNQHLHRTVGSGNGEPVPVYCVTEAIDSLLNVENDLFTTQLS